jgi:hypothetical protein
MLDYSGMELVDGVIVNKNPKIGDISIEGKALALPYFETLKNPEGKVIFHPLHENYTSPENTVFNLYRKRLVLEMNLRLSTLIVSVISLASDVQLQQRVKNSKLIELVSSLGEVDLSLIEAFMNAVKASKKVNEEGFVFNLHLKKNGAIKEDSFAAIGKVNFCMYTELVKALDDKERDYRVFGAKLRKKDLTSLIALFQAIFPNIEDQDLYSEGTDHRVFRYLNILLKTSYLVSSLMNQKADLLAKLNEPSLNVEDIYSNLKWANQLEELNDMAKEIRMIPNQVDVSLEPTRLKVDERSASQAPLESTVVNRPPVFDPQKTQAQLQPQVPTPQQPPSALTAEEVIQSRLSGMNNPQYIPQMMQPVMQMPPQNVMVPSWVRQELAQTGQPQQMPMQPQYPQQFQQPMQPQYPQQFQQPMQQQYPQQFQQPMQQQYPQQFQQPFNPQMMQQPMQQPMQSGLQLNPHFVGGRAVGGY